MEINILSFTGTNKELFNKAIQLRFSVFVDELGIEKDLVYDGGDFDATHFLMLADDVPVCTCRFVENDNFLEISDFCVSKLHRSMGFGTLMVRYVLHDLLPSKLRIYLSVPVKALSYFTNFGFVVQSGNNYEKSGVKFVKLFYNR